MPILEYTCRACSHQFEFLKLPGGTAVPQCPECQGDDLERRLSGFALNTRELTEARVKAARKQRIESKDHKDMKVAETEESDHHHH